MTYRYSDGSDKIAAFEQGMTNEDAHTAFETSGVFSVVVAESFLVAYSVGDDTVTELIRRRLYDNGGSVCDVGNFLAAEAHAFGKQFVQRLE